MDLNQKIADLQSRLALSRFIPEGLEKKDSLLFWRTRILAAMLLFGTIVGTLVMVPVYFLATKEGLWQLLAMDLVMCAVTPALLVSRNLRFSLRAGLTLAMVYLVGMVVMATAGVISGGPAWLFAFAVFSGVLMGYRGALLALGINTLSLTVIGILLNQGIWSWGVAQVTYYSPELIVTAIVNFIFMNGAASLSVSVLVRGLVESHQREVRLASSLEQEQRRLAWEIRDRRQANLARAESQERYRTILDSIEDGYFEVDLEGNFTFFNGALARLTGVPDPELSGLNYRALMDEANGEKLVRAFRKTYDTGESSQVLDCKLIRRDQRPCDIEMVVSLIRNRQGAITGFRGIARDVSSRIAMEKRLRQSSKMESIGTLAAGIAHDFNNVLYIILGNADLVLDDLPESMPARQNLAQIKTASLRAADIVKQLLSFSRETEQHLVPLDLTDLIREELGFLRSTFPASVEIRSALPSNPVPVMGDRVQIKQLMINLFTNAVQAMEGRSARILLSLAAVPRHRALPRGGTDPRSPGAAVLVIEDRGPGIQKQDLDRIFDPYFTTKEVGKGSGMGLAVVHGIVKNHNGHIEVTSREGEGARFELVFPLTESPLAQSGDKAAAGASLPRGRERILVVDDEASIVGATTTALQRLGYTVQGLEDPGEAWALFDSRPEAWDLVITDMSMPGMTGDVLARRICRRNGQIPVLICTGYDSFPQMDTGPDSGRITLLKKPVTLEQLAGRVRAVLDQASGSLPS